MPLAPSAEIKCGPNPRYESTPNLQPLLAAAPCVFHSQTAGVPSFESAIATQEQPLMQTAGLEGGASLCRWDSKVYFLAHIFGCIAAVY